MMYHGNHCFNREPLAYVLKVLKQYILGGLQHQFEVYVVQLRNCWGNMTEGT